MMLTVDACYSPAPRIDSDEMSMPVLLPLLWPRTFIHGPLGGEPGHSRIPSAHNES